SKSTDPWPAWETLFTELARRGLCTWAARPAVGRRRPDDWRSELRRDLDRRDGVDMVFVQGAELAGAVEIAAAARAPVVWHLPGAPPVLPRDRAARDETTAAAAGGRLQRALTLPYQVVFNNAHSLAVTAAGRPQPNFMTIDGVLFPSRPQVGAAVGAPPAAWDRTAARARLAFEWTIPPDVQLLLAVGPLNPGRGADVVLEAYRRLRTRHPQPSYLLMASPSAADPSHLGRLRRQLRTLGNNVGLAADPTFALTDAYAAADLLLLHEVDDPRPAAALHGLHFGLPMVGTPILTAGDLLYDGSTGWTAPAFRPGPWADALHSALRDSAELERRGRNARAWLDTRLDPEAMTAAWGELLLEAAELRLVQRPVAVGSNGVGSSSTGGARRPASFASAPSSTGAPPVDPSAGIG
ncbi:MAG: glycosyltransferase, partial [Planctomycetia bacterium]